MIRNYLKFIGIFTFLSSNCFAAEGGMPQLNPDYWVSQVFWVMLIFGTLYVILWKTILPKINENLENRKSQIEHLFIYLFMFFIIINISCYWFAMITAFPYLVLGSTFNYYFKIQFPVGFLGALFDTFWAPFLFPVWPPVLSLASRPGKL